MRRGAIIGLGNVAVHGHLPGWLRRRDVQIVAATDSRSEQRAQLAALAPDARWCPTADELLAEASLDFVDICTPPVSHAPLIRSALERGLHVLCEKPLVGSPDELTPLVELAAATGRALHTVHNWHHAPIVRRTAELIREGRIGAVTRVVWHTFRTRPAVTGDEPNGNWRVDPAVAGGDRKSTRLNSSHLVISYAVFCLKKKNKLYQPGPGGGRGNGYDHQSRCVTRILAARTVL